MKRLLLGSLLSAVIVVPSLLAQEQKPPTPAATSPQQIPSQSTNVVRMTERQVQEMRADILMAKKMYPEAVKEYEHLLSQSPKDAELMNKIGVAFQEEGDSQTAGRYYKRAVKTDKTYVSAVNNLGTIEYEKRHYGKAIRW
jgi:Tfp pilus assembly protein PilF